VIRGYTRAELQWPGWRESIPGTPADGVQQHGFTAATVDPASWKRTAPNSQGHGSEAPWDSTWGGTALEEGDHHSDYVYRTSAEMRPRANANGGANVIYALQTRRSAGYGLSPGNYKALGAVVSIPPMLLCPMDGGGGGACGPGPPMEIVTLGPGATNTVTQPPPSTPAPSNITAWTVPPVSPSPSPTVSATPTTAASSDPITTWLSQSTIIPGVENLWLAGGALLAAFLLLHHGGGK